MQNLLGILKKENKEREKRLIISDRRLISDMVSYIKTKKICDYDAEMFKKSLIRTALRTYGSKKKDFRSIVGEDFQDYCCRYYKPYMVEPVIRLHLLLFQVRVALLV